MENEEHWWTVETKDLGYGSHLDIQWNTMDGSLRILTVVDDRISNTKLYEPGVFEDEDNEWSED